MSPSWKLHRLIGKIVCNFYDHRIDELIDIQEHDIGRYDKSALSKQFDYVWDKWGWEGICYYLLHHILDRISDILVSELSHLGEKYLDGVITLEEGYKEIVNKVFEKIKKDYYIQGLAKTGCKERDELIKYAIEYILASLEVGKESCIGFILMDTSSQGKLTTGSRVFTAMISKSVAREFKGRGKRFTSKELTDFLIEIGKIAEKEMKQAISNVRIRTDKLTRIYEQLFPQIKKAVEDYENLRKRLY